MNYFLYEVFTWGTSRKQRDFVRMGNIITICGVAPLALIGLYYAIQIAWLG